MRIVNIMLSGSAVPFGTEQVAYKYTNLFLEKGHDVLFIYKNTYDEEGVEKKHPHLTRLRLQNKSLLSLIKMRFFIKRWQPDVIFVHNFFSRTRFAGAGIAPMFGIAHLEKFWSMKAYEAVISLRPDSVALAKEQGVLDDKIFVIPNTCNLTKSFPAKQKWHDVPVIGAMGRLSDEKNFATLIRACALLNRQNIPFRLVLAGSGAQENELKSLVKKEGLENLVTFLGFVTDASKFYQSIDVFCVPSSFEPFGLVLLEAMFSSKPIVASSVISFQQILTNKTGLLSETFSPESFAKKLEWALSNPYNAIQMGQNARAHYDKNYAPDVLYEKLMGMVKTVKKY
ncbi:MAG: glycosyltransferase family 4 protein [Methylococcaceae bacterium]|nr:glycosyltransferase family 4 protein [Methylococcaceae bacterium]